jgi:hypothetical protein
MDGQALEPDTRDEKNRREREAMPRDLASPWRGS